MDEIITQVQTILATYGLNIIAALAILLIGKWLARILQGWAVKAMTRSKVDETLIGFLSNIIYALLLVFVVLAALGQLGVETTSFIAILGAAGLAVGLALQGSLSNFASGVMIIIFRPFKKGDFVEIAGVAGIIEEVQIFTCRLRTGDNKAMYIPNGKIMGDNIVNFSANPTRRVDMVFGCGYDDDIRACKALLLRLVEEDERILPEPAPVIGVSELGDNSVNFVVRPWVKASDYWPVYFDMHEKVKIAFDEAGLNIPYPQRDVHIHEVKSVA